MRTVLVAAVVVAGCSSDLPSSSHIDKLRVLAVRAEPPEVAPGQVTTLDALVVEPIVPQVDDLGPPNGPSYYWLACSIPPGAAEELPCGVDPSNPLPGTPLDAQTCMSAASLLPDCATAPTAAFCRLSETPTAQLKPDSSRTGSDGTGQLLVTMVVSDQQSALECLCNVIAQGGEVVTAGGDTRAADHCVLAVKRLAISDPNRTLGANKVAPPAPNKNPTITNLFYVDGAGMNVPLLGAGSGFTIAPDGFSARLTLAATRSADAAELEPQLDSNGKPKLDDGGNLAPLQVEALTVAWFLTGGSIEGGRSAWIPEGCLTQADCPTAMPISEAVTKWNPPTQLQLTQTSTASDPRVNFWAVIRDDRGGVGWVAGTAKPWP